MAAVGFVQSDVACHVVRSFGRETRRSFGRSRVVPTLLRVSGDEATPERTTFVRFRKALIAQHLDKALFDEIATQLKAKAIRVKTGTLVDATIIASASEGDDEARWVKHKGRAAVYGFKAHVGADADTALVEEIAITPANVNDGKAGPLALPDEPGEVFADSAYRGKTFREAVQAKGGCLRVAATGMWGRDEAETLARLGLGTGRSTAFVAASKKSSERGSEATAFDACAGEGSQRRVCKSASPPSLIISNAAPAFSPQPDRCALWRPPAAQPPKRPASPQQ